MIVIYIVENYIFFAFFQNFSICILVLEQPAFEYDFRQGGYFSDKARTLAAVTTSCRE